MCKLQARYSLCATEEEGAGPREEVTLLAGATKIRHTMAYVIQTATQLPSVISCNVVDKTTNSRRYAKGQLNSWIKYTNTR